MAKSPETPIKPSTPDPAKAFIGAETYCILKKLDKLNKAIFLKIASQPNVHSRATFDEWDNFRKNIYK